jgi:hypothetical protein
MKKENLRKDLEQDKVEPEITELYNGRVIVKFHPKSHQYWVSVNGKPFVRKTGVTTYIGIKDKSRPLQSWQQGITADFLLEKIRRKEKIDVNAVLEAVVQHELRKEEAADIGKEIHGWCEHYIRHKLKQKGFEKIPDMPNFPEAVTGVNSFFAWEKDHKVKYDATEKPVYSIKHDFIGTEDLVATIDGLYCDADFKSSNGLYNSVRMQTSAYAKARMEEGGKKTEGRWAIRFSKYSEEEYMKREERKAEIRKAIAKIQGRPANDYPIKPYQVFEAKFLDNEKGNLERDFGAFLNAKALFEWDRLTDPFYIGENW